MFFRYCALRCQQVKLKTWRDASLHRISLAPGLDPGSPDCSFRRSHKTPRSSWCLGKKSACCIHRKKRYFLSWYFLSAAVYVQNCGSPLPIPFSDAVDASAQRQATSHLAERRFTASNFSRPWIGSRESRLQFQTFS